MARLLTSDTTNGVTETFSYDEGSDTVLVRHSENVDPIIEAVAAANLEGVREVPGLGVPQFEVPTTVAMEFCRQLGIPWERFLYSNEYDHLWLKFGQAHSRLQYRKARTQFAVAG